VPAPIGSRHREDVDLESRCYHQFCGLARALDRVGERWTLLIVRDLLLGPRRYGQLLESLQGLTTNLLAKRLKDLQRWGLIERQGSGSATRYRLTPDGAALEPAIMELARWGGRYMGEPPGPLDRLDLSWALLSRKRVYSGGLTEFRVGLETESRQFEMLYLPERLVVQEREALGPHLRVRGPEKKFFTLLLQGRVESGLEVVELAPGSLARWLGCLGFAP